MAATLFSTSNSMVTFPEVVFADDGLTLQLKTLSPSSETNATEWLRRVFCECRDAELQAAGVQLPEALLQMQYHAREQMIAARYPKADRVLVFCKVENALPVHSVLSSREPVAALSYGWYGDATDTLHLIDIAVRPAWQHRGIGSALIRAVQEVALRRGADVALHVAIDNKRARRLYSRLHFFDMPPGDPPRSDANHPTQEPMPKWAMYVSMRWRAE